MQSECNIHHKYQQQSCLPLTNVCLSVGEDLASTRSLGQTLSRRSCSIWIDDEAFKINLLFEWKIIKNLFWPAHLSQFIAYPPVKLFAFKAQEVVTGMDNATLDCNSSSGVNVVPCDHTHSDASSLTLLNSIWDLWRLYHPGVRCQQTHADLQ